MTIKKCKSPLIQQNFNYELIQHQKMLSLRKARGNMFFLLIKMYHILRSNYNLTLTEYYYQMSFLLRKESFQ
jgi:hypothetical protein